METRANLPPVFDQSSFEPTYEEWKLLASYEADFAATCFEPTYEEWKQRWVSRMQRTHQVLSLPMRNGNEDGEGLEGQKEEF